MTEQIEMDPQELFFKVFHASQESISIVKMPEFVFVDVNEAFERISGYSKDEVIGKTSDDIEIWRHPEDREQMIPQYLKDRYINDISFDCIHKSGNIVKVRCNFRLINYKGVDYSVAIATDVTEQWKVEKELLRNQKELRELAGQLILNQEEELSRLARELHDNLTQQLAIIAIDAGSIMNKQELPSSIAPLITEIKEKVIKASTDIHNISHELHPGIIHDLGLVRAIRSECRGFLSRRGVAVIFTSENVPDDIPDMISLHLYRIIQEALFNIAKYAETENAFVFLESSDHQITLSVRDAGVGFHAPDIKHKVSLGISSMRERTRIMDGVFKITSERGKGTSVEVTVPLNEDEK